MRVLLCVMEILRGLLNYDAFFANMIYQLSRGEVKWEKSFRNNINRRQGEEIYDGVFSCVLHGSESS